MDVKIVDGGSYESKFTFEAGADLVTVPGLVHEMTISAAVEEAEKYRKAVMVDLLGVANIHQRVAGVERLGRNTFAFTPPPTLGVLAKMHSGNQRKRLER